MATIPHEQRIRSLEHAVRHAINIMRHLHDHPEPMIILDDRLEESIILLSSVLDDDAALATQPTPPEQPLLVALTGALEYDVTPLQWLRAFMTDVSEYIDWGRMDDPQAAYAAYKESCLLTDKLTDIVAVARAGEAGG